MLSEDDMVNADQPPNQTPTIYISRPKYFQDYYQAFNSEFKQLVSKKGGEINCQMKDLLVTFLIKNYIT